MFAEECQVAAELNKELGLGVGLFQAGTNLFLNGLVYLFWLKIVMWYVRLLLFFMKMLMLSRVNS